jgi:hypothetical protein
MSENGEEQPNNQNINNNETPGVAAPAGHDGTASEDAMDTTGEGDAGGHAAATTGTAQQQSQSKNPLLFPKRNAAHTALGEDFAEDPFTNAELTAALARADAVDKVVQKIAPDSNQGLTLTHIPDNCLSPREYESYVSGWRNEKIILPTGGPFPVGPFRELLAFSLTDLDNAGWYNACALKHFMLKDLLNPSDKTNVFLTEAADLFDNQAEIISAYSLTAQRCMRRLERMRSRELITLSLTHTFTFYADKTDGIFKQAYLKAQTHAELVAVRIREFIVGLEETMAFNERMAHNARLVQALMA